MHIDFTIPQWILGVIGTAVVGVILLYFWIKNQLG
jgi:hypothetical protein